VNLKEIRGRSFKFTGVAPLVPACQQLPAKVVIVENVIEGNSNVQSPAKLLFVLGSGISMLRQIQLFSPSVVPAAQNTKSTLLST
jgi:hypothetical protein